MWNNLSADFLQMQKVFKMNKTPGNEHHLILKVFILLRKIILTVG